MGIWFNRKGEEYYGETEKNWWKKYIDRLFKEHKERTPLDHPDGSVTDEKIGIRTVTSSVGGRTVKADLTGHIGNLLGEIDELEDKNDAHIKDTDNPHNVTKEQIGLGNVPNLATNDQTPTYTESATLERLASGEKLSIAFGKISKAITDLIYHSVDNAKHITAAERTNWNDANSKKHSHSNKTVLDGITSALITAWNNAVTHKTNTDNPHSVTKEQVGLGNVDNTSDIDKPVSDAVKQELKSKADRETSEGGFEGGSSADADWGGAVGSNAKTNNGGSVGYATESTHGGAVGENAYTVDGGAVGANARTSDGFAGGYNAQTVASQTDDTPINAIQLGEGTNINEKTLQVYDYQMMDASGNIPVERIKSATNDQTPTYTESATLERLASGEKLSRALSKISKIVSDYITHRSQKPQDGALGHVQLSDSPESSSDSDTTAASTLSANKLYKNIETHKADTTAHITAAERTNWNDANSKKHSHSNKTVLDGIDSDLIEVWNNKSERKNAYDGFDGGSSAEAADGGAIGDHAKASRGGAVGHYAKTTNGFAGGNEAISTTGGAVGENAKETDGGGAVGEEASAAYGGAVGIRSKTSAGGSVGEDTESGDGGAVGGTAITIDGFSGGLGANSTYGGAVGEQAKTGNGFAGGYYAKTVDSANNGIDAIQLGTGTNSTAKTLQVYDYTLMKADGTIPEERMANSNGGFAGGTGAKTQDGGAIGYNAGSKSGGAVGNDTDATTGFAGGNGARALSGGAVGNGATSNDFGFAGGDGAIANGGGGSVGSQAKSDYGGFAGGENTYVSSFGGAVGANARTSDGFAGGYYAKTVDSADNGIDAIQLGTGTNSTAKTLQVYDYTLMKSDGTIPYGRLPIKVSEEHTLTLGSGYMQAVSHEFDSNCQFAFICVCKAENQSLEVDVPVIATAQIKNGSICFGKPQGVTSTQSISITYSVIEFLNS